MPRPVVRTLSLFRVTAPNASQKAQDIGNALIAEAKRLSPGGLTLLVNTDNARAIRFYTRNGFVHTHDDVNPVSGRKVYGMKWTP